MLKELFIETRNLKVRFIYKKILRPILFRFDPELIHDWFIKIGSLLGKFSITRLLTRYYFSYSNNKLKQTIHGQVFKNPIGLAAGFDKNAQLTDILPAVGFGFIEVGSITGEPCECNAKPRLWRLIKSESIVVYYGLFNRGAEVLEKFLKPKSFSIPLVTSLAKTNNQATAEMQAGIVDYVKAHQAFSDIGNFTTINISCPNAFGGEPFTDKESLSALLTEIDRIETNKPCFIKIAPDLTETELDGIIEVIKQHNVAGIICGNSAKKRSNLEFRDKQLPEKGGISGKVIIDLSTSLVKQVYQKTNGQYLIIGCGGITTAEEAYQQIKNGASLIQLITGMIYEGPQLISEINQGLVKLLEQDGYKNITEAIGVDVR